MDILIGMKLNVMVIYNKFHVSQTSTYNTIKLLYLENTFDIYFVTKIVDVNQKPKIC